ncbi:MAG: hypothetical protein R3Y26_12205 [Rikenellaceae bacterium]
MERNLRSNITTRQSSEQYKEVLIGNEIASLSEHYKNDTIGVVLDDQINNVTFKKDTATASRSFSISLGQGSKSTEDIFTNEDDEFIQQIQNRNKSLFRRSFVKLKLMILFILFVLTVYCKQNINPTDHILDNVLNKSLIVLPVLFIILIFHSDSREKSFYKKFKITAIEKSETFLDKCLLYLKENNNKNRESLLKINERFNDNDLNALCKKYGFKK